MLQVVVNVSSVNKRHITIDEISWIDLNAEYLSDAVDNVINLEDASDSLTGQGDGAGADQKRLDNILLQDVGDGSLPHIDTSCFLSLGVSVSQFSHSSYKLV